MIPVKLVETVFQKYWALILPVLLVPLLALALTHKAPMYRSQAVVWISDPVAGESLSLGYSNPYSNPAQNQAQVLNDLLGTESFRVAVGKSASIIDATDDESEARRIAEAMKVYAGARGVNLVTITSDAHGPDEAQAIVNAVILEYEARALASFERDSTVATGYYSQQLEIATKELGDRQAALNLYVAAHPRALTPGSAESLDIDYRTLLDRVTTQSTLVENLKDSLQNLKLRSASAPQTQQAAFTVQDAASLPKNPIPTSITKTVGMPMAGLVFGVLLGCGYLYFSYRTDHTIRSAADIEELQVPLLGSVPDLRPGPAWLARTPVGLALSWRRRDFARKTAASITGRVSATGRSS